MIEVPIVLLDDELAAPAYARVGDAGADLVAREDLHLAPAGGRGLVSTGVAIAIPVGYAGLVLPRSGLASRHGITCLNSPGLIDSGYRGEIQVLLLNTDAELAYEVRRGDRVAQLVILPVAQAQFMRGDILPTSQRGEGGFGHTGR